MNNEIELISDRNGLAVIGDSKDVELFLESQGLASTAVALPNLARVMSKGAATTSTVSEIAASSGRWVKLTKESAEKLDQFGAMPTKSQGVSHAMIGKPGDIKSWLQLQDGVGALATNPAMLAGAAGVMSQLAMEQTMAEITDYLARIDEKLDDVLRTQTNQVLAQMDGVDLAIKEATSVRDSVGRVSEVTWSKVQSSSTTIHETQGFALRQLSDLAEKLERKSKVDELVKVARDAEEEVQKWLAVLARCFQLHDAVAVLELDRVLDASPEELERHRVGLQAARRDRLELIAENTKRLLTRMTDAVDTANSKVLFNPIQSPAIVKASNVVATDVHDFHGMLGIESGTQSSEAARWKDAASEQLVKARETGAGGIDTVKNLGSGTRDQAKSVKNKLTGKLKGRKISRGEGDQIDD